MVSDGKPYQSIIIGFPIKFNKHILSQSRAGGLWSRFESLTALLTSCGSLEELLKPL